MVGPTGDALLIKQAPPLFLEAFSVAYPSLLKFTRYFYAIYRCWNALRHLTPGEHGAWPSQAEQKCTIREAYKASLRPHDPLLFLLAFSIRAAA